MYVWCYLIAFTSYYASVSSDAVPCTTPNGEAAFCKNLALCPGLLTVAQLVDDANAQEFVQKSACKGQFLVCCGEEKPYILKPTTPGEEVKLTAEEKRSFAMKNIIPDKNVCGKQRTDDYDHDKDEISVGDFPWMVYILSKNIYLNGDNKFDFSLAIGFIITERFILTESYHYNENLTDVRVGQHQILSERACIRSVEGDDCSIIRQSVSVVDFFENKYTTILLLLLDKKLSWNNKVRPICLPFQEYAPPVLDQIIFASGWGSEEFVDDATAREKKLVKHRLLDQQECEESNRIENPICAIVFDNSQLYVCSQDNGGPIMYRTTNNKKNWIATGIITSVTECAKYQPMIGERFTNKTLNWILDVIYEHNNI